MSNLAATPPVTVPVLLQHFTNAINAQPKSPDLTPFQLFDGTATSTIPDRYIQYLSIENYTQQPASLGNLRRDEDYEIVCVISVYTGDPTEVDTVRSQAWGLWDSVQLEITNDPWANPGAGPRPIRFWQMSKVTATEGAPDTADGGWTLDIDFTIRVEATLER